MGLTLKRIRADERNRAEAHFLVCFEVSHKPSTIAIFVTDEIDNDGRTDVFLSIRIGKRKV